MARKGRFTQTLTEKLLVYGTGREMTYRDHEEIAGIAMELAESGYGLRDLVVAVASSEVFAKR